MRFALLRFTGLQPSWESTLSPRALGKSPDKVLKRLFISGETLKLFYLPLLLLLLTSIEVSAKRRRPAPRLDKPTTSAKVKSRRPSRSRYTKPSPRRRNRVKPRTRIVKPKPVVKPKVTKPSPKMKYHNLRYLWLNEVLGNTNRRTIRKKLKLKKKRQRR